MNNLKLPEIKNLLGVKTYKQALICYEKGDVRNFKLEGTTAEALVTGSSLSPNRVRVNFKGTPPEMECDCAYPYLCKHIGAVLIKIVNENYILEELSPFNAAGQKALRIKDKQDEELCLSRHIPSASPAAPEEESPNREKVVSSDRDSLQLHLREVYKNLLQLSCLQLIPSDQPDPASKPSIKLAFVIRSEGATLGLKPALVNIKANGKPGRIERFIPERLTEPVTRDEAGFLRWLTAGSPPELQRIADCLPFFINKSISALYLDNAQLPLKLECINSLTIRFRVHSLDWHKTVYFKPLLYFNLPRPEADRTGCSASPGGIRCSGIVCNSTFLQFTSQDSVYLDKDHAVLYYRQADADFVAFLSLFREHEPLFTFQDLELLSKMAAIYAVPVSIDFPFEMVRLKAVLPVPLLRITENSRAANRETVLTLAFRYLNIEVPYESDPPFIINPDDYHEVPEVMADKSLVEENMPDAAVSDRSILVLERQGEYEGLIYRAIKELVHKELKQRYYVWSNRFFPPAHLPLLISADTFLHTYGEELLANGIELQLGRKQVKLAAGILLDVKTDNDWFDIKLYMQDTENRLFPVREGYRILSLPEFAAGDSLTVNGKANTQPGSVQEPKRATGLFETGDTYLLINPRELTKLRHLYETGRDRHESLKISRYNFQWISGLYEQIINREDPEIKQCREIMNGLKNFRTITPHEQPLHFNGTLRNYQLAGYSWLLFLHEYQLNGCLADDMGLGKTVQTLAMLQHLKNGGQAGLSVLVLPVVTISNWEREIHRFTPQLSFVRHTGKDRFREPAQFAGYDLVLVSYHTLRIDLALFRQLAIEYLILDEAHHIKNVASQIYKAIRSLNSRHRLSLTGTPLENHALELWAQMDFLNPGLLGNRMDFKNRYLTSGGKEATQSETKPASGSLAGAQARLKKLVFPFILRRKKEDVLVELPPKEEIIHYVEMGERQQQLYNQLKEKFREEVLRMRATGNEAKTAVSLFAMLLRLRQMVLFPQMVDKKFAQVESAKFEALRSLLEEVTAEGHKVLVFSQFIEPLHIIRDYCEQVGIKSVTLTGQTKNREEVIRDFQENPGIQVFLLSLKAGGVGINLTAAGYVILFDPWWNPAVEAQALDRAHRIGQSQKVLAYKLIVKDSIEEKILKLQARKKQLVSELITNDKNFFKSLSREDIQDLFI